jgi:hypothetical protein
VCDLSRSACVDGCRFNGDCDGASCRCGSGPCACSGATAAEVAACPLGVCDAAFCAHQAFCPFGQVCDLLSDGGSGLAQCYSDFDIDRRPYCASCTWGGGVSTCGTGPNFCLVDTYHPGNSFCGADCSQGQSCPNGYACHDIIVVGTAGSPQCSPSNPACPVNAALDCTADADCPRGGTCVPDPGQPGGHCAGGCSVGENQSVGYCTCLVDADCAQDSCSAGECTISRRPCVTVNDCPIARCVDFDGHGGCLIGQNCAPADGLSCNEVQ